MSNIWYSGLRNADRTTLVHRFAWTGEKLEHAPLESMLVHPVRYGWGSMSDDTRELAYAMLYDVFQDHCTAEFFQDSFASQCVAGFDPSGFVIDQAEIKTWRNVLLERTGRWIDIHFMNKG